MSIHVAIESIEIIDKVIYDNLDKTTCRLQASTLSPHNPSGTMPCNHCNTQNCHSVLLAFLLGRDRTRDICVLPYVHVYSLADFFVLELVVLQARKSPGVVLP